MRIAFYTPFKPLGHHHPSGDLVIATGIYRYLASQGHSIWQPGPLRARWMYWKPWAWLRLIRVYRQSIKALADRKTDLWMTYHTYYKAPDVLGPMTSRKVNIPYVIFQGIFSTKRKRSLKTWPGYLMNKNALTDARHVFTNRFDDWINLKRIVSGDRLSYVKPGIINENFRNDFEAGRKLREAWGTGPEPVVLSAAMFRTDVKTESLAFLIRSCGRIAEEGIAFHLVIAGDGKERPRLQRLADEHFPGKVRFVGKIPRETMYQFYSAGDIFAFPGIRESLGMVYLESQACGLPVVAFDNGGIPEVVVNKRNGYLVPPYREDAFDASLKKLILNKALREDMGKSAAKYVQEEHDLIKNYREMEAVLLKIARGDNRDA